jgi:thiol-disulfide isomerase/thioredoxin
MPLRAKRSLILTLILALVGLVCIPRGLLAQTGKPAPELVGGIEWLNTDKPISLRALKGKIVLLDFWTLCCIICMQIIPELEKLEKKYSKELVVIGIHTAKFENEKDSANIKKAILRYQIKHPVVNDANKVIWNTYGANWWPTIVLIDPEGNVFGANLT